MRPRQTAVKHAISVFAFLLIVWGLYRFLFALPEEIEEILIKPIIWLAPVLFSLGIENKGLGSIGITLKRFFSSIYFALILGAVFATTGLIINYLKYQGTLTFNAFIGDKTFLYSLGLSFATAIPEEIVFRGFIFNRLWEGLKNEWHANIISSIAWSTLHIPIAIFALKMDPMSLALYIILTLLYGIGAAFVFARTKNVIAPILLHVLWEAPVILFR